MREPRQWVVCLEEDEDISDELQAEIGPYDTVFIKRYARGLFGEQGLHSPYGQIMSCWLPGPRGQKKPHFVRQYNVDVSKV